MSNIVPYYHATRPGNGLSKSEGRTRTPTRGLSFMNYIWAYKERVGLDQTVLEGLYMDRILDVGPCSRVDHYKESALGSEVWAFVPLPSSPIGDKPPSARASQWRQRIAVRHCLFEIPCHLIQGVSSSVRRLGLSTISDQPRYR